MTSFPKGSFKEEYNEPTAEQESIPTPIPKWNPRFSLATLMATDRVELIAHQRTEIASMATLFCAQMPTYLDTFNPGGNDELPANFSKLKSITLDDMYYDDLSVGNRLDLEIIEDAMSFMRVMLLGQDSAGNVIFVALYCDTPSIGDLCLQQKIGYGCKITIANPWMKIALDGRTMIRIDDDEALFIHKFKDPKKCRFCGKANAQKKCARCKKSFYCSRECQSHDWKILKHKVICDAYMKMI